MADQYQLPPAEPAEQTVPIENVQPPRPPDARPPRDRRWLPVLLIGGGVLLFLGNSGVFASLAWSVLLPLAMLAVGLDLITEGRSRRNIAIGSLVAAPVLVLLVGGANMANRAPASSPPSGDRPNDTRLEGIERIRVDIKQSAGNLEIRALDDDSRDPFSVNGVVPEIRRDGNTGVLVLHQTGWDGGNTELSIAPNLPLDMTVEVNGGNAEPIDLREVKLESLRLNVRAGNTELLLPEQGVMDVVIDSTAGNVEVVVPEELAARVEASASAGNVEVDDRFAQRDGVWFSSNYDGQPDNRATLKIAARVGNIEVE